jgi:hypothetical protein
MPASYAIITCADNVVTTVTSRRHIFDHIQNGSTASAKM